MKYLSLLFMLLLVIALVVNFYYSCDMHIGYGYVLRKKISEECLLHDGFVLLKTKHSISVVIRNNRAFGYSETSNNNIYFDALGSSIDYHDSYASMLNEASKKGIKINESDFISFLR